jgi:hypothetical protein
LDKADKALDETRYLGYLVCADFEIYFKMYCAPGFNCFVSRDPDCNAVCICCCSIISIMQALKSPLFIVSTLFFLLHQWTQHVFKIKMLFADAYLDNLLAMPIILTLLRAERSYLFKKGASYRLTILDIILTTVYIAVLSELLFPILSPRFTFDWLDFVFFFAGAALFLITGPKNPIRRKMEKDLRT